MIRTRIAPSPTGSDLHIGNVYTALINYVLAKQKGPAGKFIVRIEDTDRTRLIKGSEDKILDSLCWLGLAYDEGPDIGGPYAPYRQSERLELYKKYAEELVAKGLAYYCTCTSERLAKLREEQIKKGVPPRYDGFCREKTSPIPSPERRGLGRGPYVIRLKVPHEGETIFNDLIRGEISFKNELIDDQVLLKSDGFPTYHLGVVVDDHLMEITHVVRAEEWISSTPKHILLYKAFGWALPQFAHLPLLRNPDRSKLSKRKNPVWVSWYKEQGYLPEAILNYLCLMGWSHPAGKDIFSLEEFIKEFKLEKVQTTGPVFDLAKLDWMNGVYIRQTKIENLKSKIDEFYGGKYQEKMIAQILPLVVDRMKTLSDFEKLADFFFKKPSVDKELLLAGRTKDEVEKALSLFIFRIEKLKAWTKENLDKEGMGTVEETGLKTGDLFMILRVAITGKSVTPPLSETMVVLGKTETIDRLQTTLRKIK